MPTNLNALIRYKQIDRELRNPNLKTTIKSLQVACSEQLAEHRGIYKLISERTIRDDIRVMRSEALGFNAPIVVEDGVYSYSNTMYAVFNATIEDESLLTVILDLLLEEKQNIKSDRIDDVINELQKILKKEPKTEINYLFEPPKRENPKLNTTNLNSIGLFEVIYQVKKDNISWKHIFNLVNQFKYYSLYLTN